MGYMRSKIRDGVRRFIVEDSGVSAVHYALLLALIGMGVAVAAFWLGETITERMDNLANTIFSPGGAGSGAGAGSAS